MMSGLFRARVLAASRVTRTVKLSLIPPREGVPVAQLHVELVSVESKVWSGEADMLIARTTEGELGVLPGHAPLLGQLAEPGSVRIKTGGGEIAYTVQGGFLSITAEGVSVLAESAEPANSSAR
jgi:F-type H+-transporting ATPase subunit epsilon